MLKATLPAMNRSKIKPQSSNRDPWVTIKVSESARNYLGLIKTAKISYDEMMDYIISHAEELIRRFEPIDLIETKTQEKQPIKIRRSTAKKLKELNFKEQLLEFLIRGLWKKHLEDPIKLEQELNRNPEADGLFNRWGGAEKQSNITPNEEPKLEQQESLTIQEGNNALITDNSISRFIKRRRF